MKEADPLEQMLDKMKQAIAAVENPYVTKSESRRALLDYMKANDILVSILTRNEIARREWEQQRVSSLLRSA